MATCITWMYTHIPTHTHIKHKREHHPNDQIHKCVYLTVEVHVDLTQTFAHFSHGQGFTEVLKETMGLELVQFAALGLLLGDRVHGLDALPNELGIGLHLLVEPVQEPFGLLQESLGSDGTKRFFERLIDARHCATTTHTMNFREEMSTADVEGEESETNREETKERPTHEKRTRHDKSWWDGENKIKKWPHLRMGREICLTGSVKTVKGNGAGLLLHRLRRQKKPLHEKTTHHGQRTRSRS